MEYQSEEFTRDRIWNGAISLIQPKKGYRVAMDPIILASQVNLKNGSDKVLDVGCGVGAISLILKKKYPLAQITAIDIDEKMCNLCRCNAQQNSLELNVINVGIENFVALTGLYDYIVTNPPFFRKQSSRISSTKLTANFETMELHTWITLCLKKLRNGGIFSIIHEASRIADILEAIGKKSGAIKILPIFSTDKSNNAKRVIVQCTKGSKAETQIMREVNL